MVKWRVKIWQVPLDFVVEADTVTQAEQKGMVSQGLDSEDVLKMSVRQMGDGEELEDADD